MNWLGKVLGLVVAACGFVTAHVVVQSGNAMGLQQVPTVSLTVPTLPPTPTVTTPVPVPTVPVPPPPSTTAVPTVPTTPPVVLEPSPVPPPAVTVTVASTGGSTPPGAAPPAGATPTPTPAPAPARSSGVGGGSDSGSGSGSSAGTGQAARGGYTRPSSAKPRSKALEARIRRSQNRVSVLLTFRLPSASRVFLLLRGPAPSCRVAGYVPVRGRKGANRIFFTGRVHGRRLEPGVYEVSLSPSRRLLPGAPREYVRVVSPRRSIPLPASVPRPSCGAALPLGADPTARMLLRETIRPAARPSAPLRPPLQTEIDQDRGDAEAAGVLPSPGSEGAEAEEPGAAPAATIVVVVLVGALLIAMLTLVTRFVRGSWNP